MTDLPKAEFSPDPETAHASRDAVDPPRWLTGDRLDRRAWPPEHSALQHQAQVGPR